VAVTCNANVSDVLRFVIFHRVIPRFDWDLIMRGVEGWSGFGISKCREWKQVRYPEASYG
jgi:hypothetical protein